MVSAWLVLRAKVNGIYRLFQGMAFGASPCGPLQVIEEWGCHIYISHTIRAPNRIPKVFWYNFYINSYLIFSTAVHKLYVKSQIINILGLAGHMVSGSIQLCHFSTKLSYM